MKLKNKTFDDLNGFFDRWRDPIRFLFIFSHFQMFFSKWFFFEIFRYFAWPVEIVDWKLLKDLTWLVNSFVSTGEGRKRQKWEKMRRMRKMKVRKWESTFLFKKKRSAASAANLDAQLHTGWKSRNYGMFLQKLWVWSPWWCM